jgi:hypothetical protein
MTRDDIIKLAREAGFEKVVAIDSNGTRTVTIAPIPELERFAALVAAAEREACAQVCEEECADPDDQFKNYEDTHTDGWQDGCNSCAWAIRARGDDA